MNKPASELIARLEASQRACFDAGLHVAAMDIQSARAEIVRTAANQSGSERAGVDALREAQEALRYLADNDRPQGGQSQFNAEHLLQIANDLAPSNEDAATIKEAIECITDLGSGKGGWAWEEVIQRLSTVAGLHSPKIAAGDDDTEMCIACNAAFVEGDMVYPDASGGSIHASCCGPEMESYVNADGEPLKDGDPLPTPQRWTSAAAETSPGDVHAMKEASKRAVTATLLAGEARLACAAIDRIDVKAEAKSQEPGAVDAPPDLDISDLRLCSFNYLADELRRRGATVRPAPHGGDFSNG